MSEFAFLVVAGLIAWLVITIENEGRAKSAAARKKIEEHRRAVDDARRRHAEEIADKERRLIAKENEITDLKNQISRTKDKSD